MTHPGCRCRPGRPDRRCVGRLSAQAPSAPATPRRRSARTSRRSSTRTARTAIGPGEIGPMSLLTYKDARPWAKSIATQVGEGHDAAVARRSRARRVPQRPPPERRPTRRPSSQWASGGAPEGNPADLPAAPNYADGWTIGQPDAVFSDAGGLSDSGRAARSSTSTSRSRPTSPKTSGFRRWKCAPGNPQVVHHVIVYARPPAPRRRRRRRRRRAAAGAAPGAAVHVRRGTWRSRPGRPAVRRCRPSSASRRPERSAGAAAASARRSAASRPDSPCASTRTARRCAAGRLDADLPDALHRRTARRRPIARASASSSRRRSRRPKCAFALAHQRQPAHSGRRGRPRASTPR